MQLIDIFMYRPLQVISASVLVMSLLNGCAVDKGGATSNIKIATMRLAEKEKVVFDNLDLSEYDFCSGLALDLGQFSGVQIAVAIFQDGKIISQGVFDQDVEHRNVKNINSNWLGGNNTCVAVTGSMFTILSEGKGYRLELTITRLDGYYPVSDFDVYLRVGHWNYLKKHKTKMQQGTR